MLMIVNEGKVFLTIIWPCTMPWNCCIDNAGDEVLFVISYLKKPDYEGEIPEIVKIDDIKEAYKKYIKTSGHKTFARITKSSIFYRNDAFISIMSNYSINGKPIIGKMEDKNKVRNLLKDKK